MKNLRKSRFSTELHNEHDRLLDDSILVFAIKNNDYRAVKSLLDMGFDPNKRDYRYRTAMHYAAGFASPKLLKLLIKFGGNIYAVDDEIETPVSIAVRCKQIKNLRIICENREFIDFRNVNYILDLKSRDSGRTPLYEAVQLENYEMYKILFDAGVYLNPVTSRAITPLILTIFHKEKKIQKHLLKYLDKVYLKANIYLLEAIIRNNGFFMSDKFSKEKLKKCKELLKILIQLTS